MHDDFNRVPSTNPLSIYRYREGCYATDLLTAAIVHLDFFNWLHRHSEGANIETICTDLDVKERPTDVLLSLLMSNGLIERRASNFHLTDLSIEFLLSDSPWDVTPYYMSIRDRPICENYLRILRTGLPADWEMQRTKGDWHLSMETEAFAKQFTAGMDCRGYLLGERLANELNLSKYRHLLDIGGGSGIYSCALRSVHTHLMATVLEKPPVDEVARKYIEQRGFAGRIAVVKSDMFRDAYPPDCDVHLISNVLHDWDVPDVRRILAQSFKWLEPGGLLIVHDAFLNVGKTGPLPVTEYSAQIMHNTQGKCYSISEVRGFLEAAGFEWLEHRDTVIYRGYILAKKPYARSAANETTD